MNVRKVQIHLEILRALDQCAPMAMPEQTLKTQLQILLSPTPLLSEIRESLNFLETNRFTIAVRGELESGVKWSITDSGRAKLAEMVS